MANKEKVGFFGPKVTDWSDKVYNAGTKGWNLLRDFEPEMHRVYPATKEFTFGFYSKEGVPEVSTMGWVHLKRNWFDVDDFNSKVGIRFGITDDGSGNLMAGSNYIMVMPKWYRHDVILKERKRANIRMEKESEKAGAFAHPQDPRADEMRERAEELTTTETRTFTTPGVPAHSREKSEETF